MSSTALVAIDPAGDAQVIAFRDEAVRLFEYADQRVISTSEDLKPATDDLVLISNLKKALEEKRQEYVRPLQAYVAAINDTFKMITGPILGADQLTRQKVMAFQAEQERIRLEQERINDLRLESARREMELKGELTEPVDLVEVAPEAPKRVQTWAGSAGQRKIRKYRVVDFALLPDEYKIENSALLNKVVKAGIPEIPGVELYEEATLAVTAR